MQNLGVVHKQCLKEGRMGVNDNASFSGSFKSPHYFLTSLILPLETARITHTRSPFHKGGV